jgi:hypothetical protein
MTIIFKAYNSKCQLEKSLVQWSKTELAITYFITVLHLKIHQLSGMNF